MYRNEGPCGAAVKASSIPRGDLFFTSMNHSLVGHLHLEGKAPEELKVQLQPAVTVRGRLVDTEKDEPAAGFRLPNRPSGETRCRTPVKRGGLHQTRVGGTGISP